MTDREASILARMEPPPGERPRWLRPMDVGGSDKSGHAEVLKRMAAKGWVDRRRRAPVVVTPRRASFEYRLTAAGQRALHNHRALPAVSS